MSEQTVVRVGQVWQDWDSRRRNDPNPRLLRVDRTNARVTVCTIVGGPSNLINKTREIATRRFRPSTTGYKLVSEDGRTVTEEATA